MKRIALFFGLLFAGLLPLFCTSSLKPSEKEELIQIVNELNEIVNEQQTIIENSQNRKEQLEKLSKKQGEKITELENSCQTQSETITKLENLSESKQKTIEEQEKTIEELKSSLSEPRTSSLLTLINSIIAAVLSFCGGLLVGIIFF